MENIFFALIGFLLLLVIILWRPLVFCIKTLSKSIIMLSALMLLNYLPIGISLGANLITALFLGFLGIPGFITLLLLQILI